MVETGGAQAFINKPFTAEQVLSAVSAVLQEAGNGTD
jgi:hypothetical protein